MSSIYSLEYSQGIQKWSVYIKKKKLKENPHISAAVPWTMNQTGWNNSIPFHFLQQPKRKPAVLSSLDMHVKLTKGRIIAMLLNI